VTTFTGPDGTVLSDESERCKLANGYAQKKGLTTVRVFHAVLETPAGKQESYVVYYNGEAVAETPSFEDVARRLDVMALVNQFESSGDEYE